MLIHWNSSPEIFHLGPVVLRWYGLMFLIGFTLGYQGLKKACQWEKIGGKNLAEKLDSLLIHLVLGTTMGARLGHCLFYDPEYYLSHPLDIFKIWEGGLASHGGGIGVIISIWLFVRKNPEFKIWWLFDRIAIFTVMTGGFIRLGNLMNSEIIGQPTSGSWGFIFDRVDQVPRHPTQIYESFCYFVIFALTFFLYRKLRERTPPRLLFGMVFAGIFICRFFIEFFKEVQSPFEEEMLLNMGQLLSIPFVLTGIYFVWISLRNARVTARK
jgi:prolipoprotein diacylglyceryl transferase